MKTFIKSAFFKEGIELSEKQINQFNTYLVELKDANEKFNITAITDDKEIILKHFLDSVLITKHFDFSKIESLIDIGTGGGFPGMPLKILNPHLKVTLVDALNKRITFLNELSEKLELTNIEAIHARSEELSHDDNFREKFDLAVSRAVAYLPTLSEYCLPFVKPNGYFIPLKKGDSEDEINLSKNAIKTLNSQIENVIKYKVDENIEEHALVFIKKIGILSNKYPRSNKQIKQSPL